MIASLRGRVLDVGADQVVVEAGGVGFGVFVPARVASALSRRRGEEASLYTYLHVRDDLLQLYGFESVRERGFFVTLIGVSGVGPKVALAILSTYPVPELEAAIVRDDSRTFESIPGIGKKLAQRLVMELKDKVAGELGDAVPGGDAGAGEGRADHFLEARAALQNLGLTLREAEVALKGAPVHASLEELVLHALRTKEPDPPAAADD